MSTNQSPDHIYYNLTFYNNSYLSPTGPIQYVPASISQSRDSPFLMDPSQYNVTIARMTVSSNAVYRVYQSLYAVDANTTYWNVAVSYNGTYYTAPVIIPTGTSPITGRSAKFEDTIQGFLELVNAAYLNCQNQAIVGGAACPYGQPLFTYEPATQLISLNVPSYYGTGTVGATGDGNIGVHMSYLLYQKIAQSIDSVEAVPLQYNNHDISFNKQWTGNNRVSATTLYSGSGTGGTATDYYFVLTQDKAWASAILDQNRLIVTSSSLPIIPEYRSTAYASNFGANASNKTISSITDFLIGTDAELQSRGNPFIYIPQLYRLVSMNGSAPLTRLDIKLYTADKFGNLYELFLPPGGSLDIKLLFLKKGLSN